MTRRGTSLATAVLAATLVAAASPAGLAAQQQSSPVRISPSAAARSARTTPQGFSVVLVVGDLQAAGGDEDVPPAARRALADMKDFLPYKSYKLVDAAWIMGTTHAVSRLRGPEDREYEIEINVSDGRMARAAGSGLTTASTESRIGLSFSLREVGDGRGGPHMAASAGSRNDEVSALRGQLESLRAQLGAARARDTNLHPEVARLEQEIHIVQVRIENVQRGSEQRPSAMAPRTSGRAVMNNSFSMDLGETVVVGTSRLSGNSKALIVLLTAVPPKSTRR